MIRLAHRVAVAGLLLAVSCSGSSRVTTLAVTYTLQGIVADAVTGQRIGGDLKLYLIQGAEVRGPSRLITGSTDPLLGEYAFTGIPVQVEFGEGSTTTNDTWKVVAIRQGYQRFEAEISFFANAINIDSANAMLDAAYSQIGNIYLFPTGASAPDYTFTATYNGKPVPGATVLLDPMVSFNVSTFSTGSTLFASPGYVASLSATTDANGVAKFAGNLLSLGAGYKARVLPVAFKETVSATPIPLGLTSPLAPVVIAGLDPVDQQIGLGNLTPGILQNDLALYVTSESNAVAGSLQPNGGLVLTFSIPVSVSSLDGYTATLNPGITAAGAAGTGALDAARPVTATISADGLTLTLAPNYTTAPTGAERALSIDYTEGPPPGAPAGVQYPLIQPKDYPGASFEILDPTPPGGATRLTLANGKFVDGRVQMTAP